MLYATESENAIISILLKESESWLLVNEKLTENDFGHKLNRKLFLAISEFYNNKIAVDLPLLAQKVNKKTAILEKYLEFPADSEKIKGYVESLVKARLERNLKNLQLIFNDTAKTLDDKLNATDGFLKDVNKQLDFENTNQNHISNVVDSYLETVEYEKDIPLEERIVFTGFTDLDQIVRLYFGETSAIVGRPAMGKSSWATQVLMDSIANKWQSAYYMLEASGEHLLERYISKHTGILLRDIKDRTFYKDKQQRIQFYATLERFKNKNVHLFNASYRRYEKFQLSLQELIDKGLKFFVADFGQQLYVTKRSFSTRALELSYIAYSLSEICVTNKIHGNIVLQLNRKVEERQDKRPLLSDLKESGAWEESTATVLGLYRDEYYNPDTTEKPNIAEVIILKNRNGATGVVDLFWHGSKFEFGNLSKEKENSFF